MANTCYAHIGGVQAKILDIPGNAAPGGQALYSAIVLDPSNNLVPMPLTGSPGTLFVSNETVSFSIGSGASTNVIQNLVIADIQSLWGDNTIRVVFL